MQMLAQRRTVVVQGPLAFRMRRLAAADESTLGLEVTSLPLLAARLAGGLLRPVDADDLYPAISTALAAGGFAELQSLRDLPGMTRAVARTLRKLWDSDALTEGTAIVRLTDLALIERRVRDHLNPNAKLPRDLRDRALTRVAYARQILGNIELDRLSYVPAVWRPLLQSLSKVVHVRWIDPGTEDVSWFPGEIVRSTISEPPAPQVVTCVGPRSEVIESLRWVRYLLSSGQAAAHDIAICGASTDEWDEHFLTLVKGTGIPLHMSNGVPALSGEDGQACAALADLLLNGLSQERVRRLFAHAIGVSARLKELPREWSAGMSREAGLFQVEHWRRALEQASSRTGAGADVTAMVVSALAMLSRGLDVVEAAGGEFLRPSARRLWLRALNSGPPQALSLSLQDLRLSHGTEPGACVVWCPAHHLVGSPRRWVWLLGMTSGTWPGRDTEDPLLPEHLYPQMLLDPDPVSERQRRAFELIRSRASSGCYISRSRRRNAQGGVLPASPVLVGLPRAKDLRPGRTPKHAFSEPDRLLARRGDALVSPRLRSAMSCWSDWQSETLTAHDGRIVSQHAVVLRALTQSQSATSLRRLLRDPLSFVWQHALGWQSTRVASEPLELDARVFGELVHELLRRTVVQLEPAPGFARASEHDVQEGIQVAVASVREQWPLERAVPPPLLWLHTLQLAQRLAFRALRSDSLSAAARCWTEIPFGSSVDVAGDWPWNPAAPVVMSGTRVSIRGSIDRLDLEWEDLSRVELGGAPRTARVTDYKTGREPPHAAKIVIGGGDELQRVIYAIAVRQLLPVVQDVVPRLLYLREDAPRAYELNDVENVIKKVGEYVAAACVLLDEGKSLPGLKRDDFDDYALALPAARKAYFKRKEWALRTAFGAFSRVWSAQ